MIEFIIANHDTKFATELCSHIVRSNNNLRLADIVSDGIDALESICQLKPSVVILDIHLPRFDGINILSHLENQENYKPLIILVTENIKNAELKPFERLLTSVISQNTPPLKISESISTLIKNIYCIDYTEQIEKHLKRLCVSPTSTGYNFLIEAIKLTKQNIYLIDNIENTLFAIIAKNFKTEKEKVKWNILYSINRMYKKCEPIVLNEYFNLPSDEKPTPSMFINTITYKIG